MGLVKTDPKAEEISNGIPGLVRTVSSLHVQVRPRDRTNRLLMTSRAVNNSNALSFLSHASLSLSCSTSETTSHYFYPVFKKNTTIMPVPTASPCLSPSSALCLIIFWMSFGSAYRHPNWDDGDPSLSQMRYCLEKGILENGMWRIPISEGWIPICPESQIIARCTSREKADDIARSRQTTLLYWRQKWNKQLG